MLATRASLKKYRCMPVAAVCFGHVSIWTLLFLGVRTFLVLMSKNLDSQSCLPGCFFGFCVSTSDCQFSSTRLFWNSYLLKLCRCHFLLSYRNGSSHLEPISWRFKRMYVLFLFYDMSVLPVCASCSCLVPSEARGEHWIPHHCSYRRLPAISWVVGMKSKPSARTVLLPSKPSLQPQLAAILIGILKVQRVLGDVHCVCKSFIKAVELMSTFAFNKLPGNRDVENQFKEPCTASKLKSTFGNISTLRHWLQQFIKNISEG